LLKGVFVLALKNRSAGVSDSSSGSDVYDLVCIGGGPAGYSAAIYAARFNMRCVIIAKEKGGLITTTHLVENWPGFPSISGLGLMQEIEKHVDSLKVPIKDGEVTSLEKSGDLFIVTTVDKVYRSKTVLIATGSKHRELEVAGSKELYGRGVSYCATCDAAFFKNKIVAMVGGGDSAVKESLLLSEFASKVFVIHRGKEAKAEPINMKRARSNPKIEFIAETNILSIHGVKRVEYVLLDKPFNGSDKLELSGVFVAIGQIPATELAKSVGVKLNKYGEIIVDRYSVTGVPGIFAAGDCTDTAFKQAIIASAQGVYAAWQAFEHIQHHS
jgi:thioredoxin reductase (NADPH)